MLFGTNIQLPMFKGRFIDVALLEANKILQYHLVHLDTKLVSWIYEKA